MKYVSRASLSVFLLGASLYAQTKTPSAQEPARQSGAQKEADPELLQRYSIAVTLLESLAIEARSYRDGILRARIQARIADALWNESQDTARNLFRRAWEAAELIDTASPASGNSVPGRLAKDRPDRTGTNLRREILQIAARRDHVLGQEFLKKLTPKDHAEPSNNGTNPSEISGAESTERLRLAMGFVESGEIERAVQYADPALMRITTGAIMFLVQLRDKNAVAADQRFVTLLGIANLDPTADANTVSLLTSYAFTPSVYLSVSPSGIPSSNSYQFRPAPDMGPVLRKSYFHVTSNILLRPLAQIDQSSAGRPGTYFIATRLLPLFQQFAPELVPAINVQLAALGPEAARATANAGDRAVNRGMNENGGRGGIDEELSNMLQRAQGSDARDRAYAFAATRAADEGDPRARDYLDKIWDLETRAGVRRFVDYSVIRHLLGKERVEEALALIRKADLSRTLRAHFLTKAATIVGDTDRGRAIELLNEALTEARRIEASTPERAYSLIAITSGFSKFEKTRVWQLLSEAVKAANSVAVFTGEDGHTTELIEGKFSIRIGTELMRPTELSDLFSNLAEGDFYQAIDAARAFSGEAPRALAIVSVGRTVLNQKPSKSS